MMNYTGPTVVEDLEFGIAQIRDFVERTHQNRSLHSID